MRNLKSFYTTVLSLFLIQLFFTSCTNCQDKDDKYDNNNNYDYDYYYTVEFNINYKTSSEDYNLSESQKTTSESIKNDSNVTFPAKTRKAYKLLGWAENADAKEVKYKVGDSITVTSDLTFYAVWQKAESHIITFDANFIKDEATEPETKTQTVKVTSEETIVKLKANTFMHSGYVFYGWYIEPVLPTTGSKSSFYTDESDLAVEEDITLYACWLEDDPARVVKITFNKNDGSDEEVVQYLKYNSASSAATDYNKLRRNTFVRENYEFLGWSEDPNCTYWNSYSDGNYKDEDDGGNSGLNFTKEATLYAVWKYSGPVTITFDANGGKDNAGNTTATQTATVNADTILNENTFTREHYTFVGWAETADATKKTYSDGGKVSFSQSKVTLYAVWKADYVITFDGNGGATAEGEKTANQYVKEYTYTALNPNPFTKENSTFIGWNTYKSASSANYTDEEEISIDYDRTLYAIWKDDITITFDGNGGTGDSFTKSVKYNVGTSNYTFTFPENTFTRDGYTFAGWGKSPTSSIGSSYKVGDTCLITVPSNSTSVTLYAVWAETSVSITFKPNTAQGGSGKEFIGDIVINQSTLKYEATLPKNTFTNSNGTFVGWSIYDNPTGSKIEEIMEAESSVTLSPATLLDTKISVIYAIWNPETYTVTYDMNGNGENIVKTVTNTADYGKSMTYYLESTPDSSLDYYTFRGWSKTEGSTTPELYSWSSIELNSDTTLYAVWELTGAIFNDTAWRTISSSSKSYREFTLTKTETISVSVTASGALDFYLMTEENGKKFLSGSSFNYYRTVSGKAVTSINKTVELGKGTYYYGVHNGNILLSKDYKVTIK